MPSCCSAYDWLPPPLSPLSPFVLLSVTVCEVEVKYILNICPYSNFDSEDFNFTQTDYWAIFNTHGNINSFPDTWPVLCKRKASHPWAFRAQTDHSKSDLLPLPWQHVRGKKREDRRKITVRWAELRGKHIMFPDTTHRPSFLVFLHSCTSCPWNVTCKGPLHLLHVATICVSWWGTNSKREI